MANPIVIKIAADAAVKIVTDEKARKRVFTMILALVISFLVLISLILYLITHPLSAFKALLTDDEMSIVEEFQGDYGYNQDIGTSDPDYIVGGGQSYEGIVFGNAGETQVVYFSQLDERWSDAPYGSSTVSRSGCGPTSMSIVVSTLTGTTVDPPHMAVWAYQNGYYCDGNGSYHDLIPKAAKNYGLTVEGNLSPQGIVDALSEGKLVAVIMAKGHFTKNGHFIVLRGVTAEGKILVVDPASISRSNQEWDLSIILEEARKGAGAGGPYWAIGN